MGYRQNSHRLWYDKKFEASKFLTILGIYIIKYWLVWGGLVHAKHKWGKGSLKVEIKCSRMGQEWSPMKETNWRGNNKWESKKWNSEGTSLSSHPLPPHLCLNYFAMHGSPKSEPLMYLYYFDRSMLLLIQYLPHLTYMVDDPNITFSSNLW